MNKTQVRWFKELDTIGINRDLVNLTKHGFMFKTIGCSICVDDSQKIKMVQLNTKIQAFKNMKA